MTDSVQTTSVRTEAVLRIVIPVVAVLFAAGLGWTAFKIAPDAEATGFQFSGEVARACLTLAVTSLSAGIVSFLVAEYARLVDRRQKESDKRRERSAAAQTERRRLVAELRAVHHTIKTAQLRLRAHRTVKTYGQEIRESVIPAVAQLGAVVSDLKSNAFGVLDGETRGRVNDQLGGVMDYLTKLTNEFEKGYLDASLLQEADYKWRQNRLDVLVKQDRFAQDQPVLGDLPQRGESPAWRDHVAGRDGDGAYRLPRLAILLEWPQGGCEPEECGRSHGKQFSDPLRDAMELIEGR